MALGHRARLCARFRTSFLQSQHALEQLRAWAGGEPNNRGDGGDFLAGEDYLVTWGNNSWNDLDNSASDRGYIDGYVIERNGIAGANYQQVTEDSPVNLETSLLLANDTDIDGDLAHDHRGNFGHAWRDDLDK